MKVQDIKIGEYYRHKDAGNYAWAKAIEILKPKEKENTNRFTVVRCEWMINKNATFGMIKYFRPGDLLK